MINNYQQLIKIVFLATILAIGGSYAYANWTAPTFSPPTCPATEPACNPPINTSVSNQTKLGGVFVSQLTAVRDLAIGMTSFATSSLLKLQVSGRVGAEAYCDQKGENCVSLPGSGGSGGGF